MREIRLLLDAKQEQDLGKLQKSGLMNVKRSHNLQKKKKKDFNSGKT